MTQKKCYITIETFTRSSLFSLSMFDQTPSLVESTMVVDLDKLSATLAGIGADSNKKVKRIVVGEEISFITTYEVPDLTRFKPNLKTEKYREDGALYLNANASELSNAPITQEELSRGQRVVNLKPLTDDEMLDMSMTKSQFDKLHTGPREREVGEQPFKPATRDELMAFDNMDLPELPGSDKKEKNILDAINPQDRNFSTKKLVTTSYPRDPHGPMFDSVEDIDDEAGTPIGKDLEKATYDEEDENSALFDDHYNEAPDFFLNKETGRYESLILSEDLEVDDLLGVDTEASHSAGHVVFEQDYTPLSRRSESIEPEVETVIEEPTVEIEDTEEPKETLASALSNAIDKSTEAKVTKKIEDRDYPEMGGVSEHRRSMQQNKIVMPKIEHNPPTRKKTFTRR